jgi:S1-C subfamily serine protease
LTIPVDEVNRVAPQLSRHGKGVWPGLGVAPDQWARQLKVEGALIVDVLPDSAAAETGLRPTRRDPSGELRLRDVLDEDAIKSVKDLHSALEEHAVGDSVTVTVQSGGERVPLTLVAAR